MKPFQAVFFLPYFIFTKTRLILLRNKNKKLTKQIKELERKHRILDWLEKVNDKTQGS